MSQCDPNSEHYNRNRSVDWQHFYRVERKLNHGNKLDLGGADTPRTVAAAALDLARRDPLRPAFCLLKFPSDSLSTPETAWFNWGQIAHWIFDACQQIDLLDVPSGSHIASIQPNSAEWFVLDFACQVLGHVHVAIDYRWPDAMVSRLLELSDSIRFVSTSFALPSEAGTELLYGQLVNGQLVNGQRFELQVSHGVEAIQPADLEWLCERASKVSSDAAAQILFTSGTSGEPRGVVLTHGNLLSNAKAKLDAAPQFESDLRLNILPFCHAYARTCELSTWVCSNSRLAIASDWDRFLVAARRLKPTLVNLVPSLIDRLVRESEQVRAPEPVTATLGGNVRLLQVGGAALPDSLWHKLAEEGLPPLQGYGLTEASPVVCSNRAGEQRPGTIGPAIDGVALRVDAEGQLWVHGPNEMQGYYRDPQATQSRIRDGWLATGDLVEQDADGHYRVIGRVSEVIVLSNGFKVSPELIETRLLALPWIERVMIVGQDRPFTAAILWPAWESLPQELIVGCSTTERGQLPDSPHVLSPVPQQGKLPDGRLYDQAALVACLVKRFEEVLYDLPKFMHPRRILLQLEAIDADPELVNAKGGLRRRAVAEKLKSQISELYLCDAVQDS